MLKLCLQDRIYLSSAFLFKVAWNSEYFSGDLCCLGILVALTAFLLKASASSQKKGWFLLVLRTADSDNLHTEMYLTNQSLFRSCGRRFCKCLLDYLRCLVTIVS